MIEELFMTLVVLIAFVGLFLVAAAITWVFQKIFGFGEGDR